MVRLRSPAPYSLGEFPSGQRGQTVNLLSLTSLVRIQLPPPNKNTDPRGRYFYLVRFADSARHLLRKCAGSHTRLEDRQARLSGAESWYLPFALQYGIPSFISDPCGRYFYLVGEGWASISVRQSRSLCRIPPKAVSGVLRGNTACLVQQLSPAAKSSHASHTQLLFHPHPPLRGPPSPILGKALNTPHPSVNLKVVSHLLRQEKA